MASVNPRNVRNFYAEVETEGRTAGSGPKARDGGLDVELYQRSHGDVERIAYAQARCNVGRWLETDLTLYGQPMLLCPDGSKQTLPEGARIIWNSER